MNKKKGKGITEKKARGKKGKKERKKEEVRKGKEERKSQNKERLNQGKGCGVQGKSHQNGGRQTPGGEKKKVEK